jgi:hypothetical protein
VIAQTSWIAAQYIFSPKLETMVQPLHSSFTLRPCGAGSQQQPELTFTTTDSSAPRSSSNSKDPTLRRRLSPAIRTFAPFESIERRNLPSEFEPPVAEDYWKKRSFQWQGICQRARKCIRVMEEDHRQLRRRIWQLEERVSRQPTQVAIEQHSIDTHHPTETNNKIPVSPNSAADRPPTLIVTVPKVRNCCFYLTDSEGLSDSDEYVDEIEAEEDDVVDEQHSPSYLHCQS